MKTKVEEFDGLNTKLKIEVNELKSHVSFTASLLKESSSKYSEMEKLYSEEQHQLRSRLAEISLAKDDQASTISTFKTQCEELLGKYSALTAEESSQRITHNKLKEDYANLLTQFHDLKEDQLNLVNFERRSKSSIGIIE